MKHCVLCSQELEGNLSKESEVTCWKCVMFLCMASQEKIKALYQTLKEKGLKEKADVILKRWLKEEDFDGEGGRDLGRGRPYKKALSTKQGRQKQTDRSLGR